MSDMKQLSKDTIQLQHEVRLVNKKIDVVGVIQSKVRNNVEQLRDEVTGYHADVLKIDAKSISDGHKDLIDKYDDLERQYTFVTGQLNKLLDKAEDIDQSLATSRQSALDELDHQQAVTTVQMGNLAESVNKATKHLDDHLNTVDLANIEQNISNIVDRADNFLADIAKSHRDTDNELSHIDRTLSELATKQDTLDALTVSFQDTVRTLRETLKTIDDKVCQISPLYTGPSSEDIEESFNQMADTDVEKLMGVLRDKYKQMDTESVDIVDANVEPEPVEAGQIVVTLPDEAVEPTPVAHNNTETKTKKSFFARLFGGGK